MVTLDRKDDYNFVRWASEVKKRDHYTCQVCGRRGVELNAHHILSWSDNPEDRYDLLNGITLCTDDHDAFHSIYGKGGNNQKQFDEYCIIAAELFAEAEYADSVERYTQQAIKFADGYSIVDDILKELEND